MTLSPQAPRAGDIALVSPKLNALSLNDALRKRKTDRAISERSLPLQELSNLLWAGFGINRRDGPFGLSGRTAGSASNSQEIDLYVGLANSAYLYDPGAQALRRVVTEDVRVRALTPGQSGLSAGAPVQIIFVADIERLVHTKGFEEPGLRDGEVQKSYYYVDTGLIAQNIYLYAAAHDLAAWFHNCDRPALHQALRLKPSQHVLFAQSIGYPDKGAPQ
jgi:hypothetical protein